MLPGSGGAQEPQSGEVARRCHLAGCEILDAEERPRIGKGRPRTNWA